ncbi:MAG: flippase-like domain-containing protein [Bacilli bacterium]|jgi:uncharacterized protein (TIRG00374 family)
MDEQGTNIDNVKPNGGRRSKILTALVLILSILAGIAVSFLALRRDLATIDLAQLIEASSVWLSSWYWMVGALACLVVILLTGALRIHLLLKPKQPRATLQDSYRYSLLSKYYVLITPLGLGGQPVTMVYMRKKKVPFGLATFIPMIDLFAMRLGMLIIGLVAVIFFQNVVVSWVRIAAYFGLFFTCLMPVVGISMSWFPVFEKAVVGILTRLKFLKRRDQYIKVTQEAFRKYRAAFAFFKTMKKQVLAVILLAFVSQLALVSIPFFILKAYPMTALLPNNGVPLTYMNAVSMVTYASIAVAFIPTVGNAGAIEFSFSTVFATFMEARYLFWALFAWRFLTFYIYLILGLVLTFYLGVNRRREHRRHRRPDFGLPTRVVLFTDNFFPMIDGVVRTVDAYARRLLVRGYEPIVIAPTYKSPSERLPYPVYHVPSFRLPRQEYALGLFPFTKAIKQALAYEGPLIYHTHAPFMIAHKALKHAHANNIPIMTTFHSKYYEDFYQFSHSKTISQWAIGNIVRFYHKVDEVWAVSTKTATTLRNYGYRGEINVMPNGTDFVVPPDLESYKQQARQFLGLAEGEANLLFVGHLIWQKNLKFLLDVLRQLDAMKFKYHMIFVGEGGHEKMVRKYTESLGLSGRVSFKGIIKDRLLLAGIYAASDLFFFPSVYDNAPLVIREAASVGLPSLLVRGSHSAEIIVDNISGFAEKENVERMAQRIVYLFTHPEELKTVGEAAKTTVPMNWDIIIDQAIDRYEAIIQRYYDQEE